MIIMFFGFMKFVIKIFVKDVLLINFFWLEKERVIIILLFC